MTIRRHRERLALVVLLLIAVPLTSGCGSNRAQRGATTGAGIGALASAALGGNMVTGALVGGGLGYIVGNENDKRDAEAQAAAERQARAASRVTEDRATAAVPGRVNPLVGSTWQVVSLVSEADHPEYSGLVVTFPTNSKMTTLALLPDGSSDSWVETYRLVADVMVISGTDPSSGEDYVVNARFSIESGEMILVAQDFRAVLREVEERADL